MNKLPSCVLVFKSPIELLSSTSQLFPLPLKNFGCICFVHTHKFDHCKLDPKALRCVSWDMLRHKRDINVIILLLESDLYLWMRRFLSPLHFFIPRRRLFRGRIVMKICPLSHFHLFVLSYFFDMPSGSIDVDVSKKGRLTNAN